MNNPKIKLKNNFIFLNGKINSIVFPDKFSQQLKARNWIFYFLLLINKAVLITVDYVVFPTNKWIKKLDIVLSLFFHPFMEGNVG